MARRMAQAGSIPPPLATSRGRVWMEPPAAIRLHVDAVHVWRAWLDGRHREAHRLERLLVPAERERAARFRLARDRDRFVIARALLRIVLARYLDADPAHVVFGYSRHGKPFLMEP